MEYKWYIYRNGQQFGPYSWYQLQLYISESRFSSGDHVRSDQMNDWVPAYSIPGLVTLTTGIAPAANRKPGLIIFIVVLAIVLIGAVAFLGIRFLTADRSPQLLSINTSIDIDEQDRPVGITDEFPPDIEEIFVVIEFSPLARIIPITAVWIWEEEDFEFGSFTLEMPNGSTLAIFSFTRPDNGWPAGNYRVELFHDEVHMGIAQFSVISQTYNTFEFYDDFTDFDPSVWMAVRGTSSDLGYGQSADESTIIIDSNQLILVQDIMDNGPFLHSLPFQVVPGDVVTIIREVAIQPANDKLLAQMTLFGTDDPTLSSTYTDQHIIVQYLYYNWNGDTYSGNWDNFIFNERKWDSDTKPLNLESPLPAIWNEWFTETIVYDTGSNLAAYYINGEQVASAPAFNEFTGGFLKLVISPYGWQTGHATCLNMIEILVESSTSRQNQ